MTTGRNTDAPATIFRDCGNDLGTDAKIVWAALADTESGRTIGFCYLSEKSICAKLSDWNAAASCLKPWSRPRLKRAQIQLEEKGLIAHFGSWYSGGSFRSNVYWVAPFGVRGATVPPWRPKLDLPPHGLVNLSHPRKHRLWKQHQSSSARLRLPADVTIAAPGSGSQVPLSEVHSSGDVTKVTAVNLAQTPLEPGIERAVVINVTSNSLIREGIIGEEGAGCTITPKPYVIPTEELAAAESQFHKVRVFLKANGRENAFTFEEWREAVESEGVNVSDELEDWIAIAWELSETVAESGKRTDRACVRRVWPDQASAGPYFFPT